MKTDLVEERVKGQGPRRGQRSCRMRIPVEKASDAERWRNMLQRKYHCAETEVSKTRGKKHWCHCTTFQWSAL